MILTVEHLFNFREYFERNYTIFFAKCFLVFLYKTIQVMILFFIVQFATFLPSKHFHISMKHLVLAPFAYFDHARQYLITSLYLKNDSLSLLFMQIPFVPCNTFLMKYIGLYVTNLIITSQKHWQM